MENEQREVESVSDDWRIRIQKAVRALPSWHFGVSSRGIDGERVKISRRKNQELGDAVVTVTNISGELMVNVSTGKNLGETILDLADSQLVVDDSEISQGEMSVVFRVQGEKPTKLALEQNGGVVFGNTTETSDTLVGNFELNSARDMEILDNQTFRERWSRLKKTLVDRGIKLEFRKRVSGVSEAAFSVEYTGSRNERIAMRNVASIGTTKDGLVRILSYSDEDKSPEELMLFEDNSFRYRSGFGVSALPVEIIPASE